MRASPAFRRCAEARTNARHLRRYGRTPDDIFKDLVLSETGSVGAIAVGYGAVPTHELEYELAMAQTKMSRERSRLKLVAGY